MLRLDVAGLGRMMVPRFARSWHDEPYDIIRYLYGQSGAMALVIATSPPHMTADTSR